jgi:hypothetical protein
MFEQSLLILAIMLALIALDLAALRWGADSRQLSLARGPEETTDTLDYV